MKASWTQRYKITRSKRQDKQARYAERHMKPKPITVRDLYELTEEQFRDLPITVGGQKFGSTTVDYPPGGNPSSVELNRMEDE